MSRRTEAAGPRPSPSHNCRWQPGQPTFPSGNGGGEVGSWVIGSRIVISVPQWLHCTAKATMSDAEKVVVRSTVMPDSTTAPAQFEDGDVFWLVFVAAALLSQQGMAHTSTFLVGAGMYLDTGTMTGGGASMWALGAVFNLSTRRFYRQAQAATVMDISLGPNSEGDHSRMARAQLTGLWLLTWLSFGAGALLNRSGF